MITIPDPIVIFPFSAVRDITKSPIDQIYLRIKKACLIVIIRMKYNANKKVDQITKCCHPDKGRKLKQKRLQAMDSDKRYSTNL